MRGLCGVRFERSREACRESNLPEVTARSQWERPEDDRDFADSWHYTAELKAQHSVVIRVLTSGVASRAHAPDARADGRASVSCKEDARGVNAVRSSG
jgi:hypothetical protein